MNQRVWIIAGEAENEAGVPQGWVFEAESAEEAEAMAAHAREHGSWNVQVSGPYDAALEG